jgi:hypothetical protein
MLLESANIVLEAESIFVKVGVLAEEPLINMSSSIVGAAMS